MPVYNDNGDNDDVRPPPPELSSLSSTNESGSGSGSESRTGLPPQGSSYGDTKAGKQCRRCHFPHPPSSPMTTSAASLVRSSRMPDHAAPTPSLDDNDDDDNDDNNDDGAAAAAAIATWERTVQASSAREVPHSIIFSSSGRTMVSVLFFPAAPNIVVLIKIFNW